MQDYQKITFTIMIVGVLFGLALFFVGIAKDNQGHSKYFNYDEKVVVTRGQGELVYEECPRRNDNFQVYKFIDGGVTNYVVISYSGGVAIK